MKCIRGEAHRFECRQGCFSRRADCPEPDERAGSGMIGGIEFDAQLERSIPDVAFDGT